MGEHTLKITAERMKKIVFIFFQFFLITNLQAEDGYRLWLRYDKIKNNQVLQRYNAAISSIPIIGSTPTIVVAKEELIQGLEGLLGKKILDGNKNASVFIGTANNSTAIRSL